MLEQVLREEIPHNLNEFPKLREGGDPYYFDSWDKAEAEPILRYWFWNKEGTKKNKKRVFVHEVVRLLENTYQAERINRRDFEQHCRRTNRDGDCGFAVIIRILEHLQVVALYNNSEYRIKDREKAEQLLG